MTLNLTRRALLGGVGAGLTLAFAIPSGARPASAASAFEPNAWLTITPGGLVTLHVDRMEMGQGIGTALAQILAEELEADWKSVKVDYPVIGGTSQRQTSGSQGISERFETVSRAGAAARLILLDAAARQWSVPVDECGAERGVVRHAHTGRSIAYADLVRRGPMVTTLNDGDLKAIALKPPSRYRLIGASIPRLDIPEKVDGRAVFGIDVFLPDMVYAKVAYPPTRNGARVRSVDDSAARRVKGHLQTVVVGDLVAVVAETLEAATEARDALVVAWEAGPLGALDSASIFRDYETRLRQQTTVSFVHRGDADGGLGAAARTLTARYTTDFAKVTPLEPMNCVARWVDGRCELFTGTQAQARAVENLARQLSIPAASIRIHPHYLGGGFGARLESDVLVEAAQIARAVRRPVKLIRSREEDMARDSPRTPTLQAMKAGLDAAGKVVAWEHTVVAKSFVPPGAPNVWTTLTGSRTAYDIPRQSVRFLEADHGISVGSYRSIGAGYTSFAVESFVDEVAHLAGADPLTFRLAMLSGSPRLANVLRLAAARAGWGTALPAGTGRGLACTTYPQEPPGRIQGSTAAVVQARVDRATGEIRVEKITCAADCGLVISPDGARAQVEGGLLFGLSSALKEGATLTRGAFDQKNFDNYPLLRMDEVPDVEVHLVDSTAPPSGTGEHATTVLAPALANAVFAAVGARVRALPLLPERVLKALRDRA